MLKVKTKCPYCGKETEIGVNPEGYAKYKAGGLIQCCLPELSADERKMLLSGTCSECWDELFEK